MTKKTNQPTCGMQLTPYPKKFDNTQNPQTTTPVQGAWIRGKTRKNRKLRCQSRYPKKCHKYDPYLCHLAIMFLQFQFFGGSCSHFNSDCLSITCVLYWSRTHNRGHATLLQMANSLEKISLAFGEVPNWSMIFTRVIVPRKWQQKAGLFLEDLSHWWC